MNAPGQGRKKTPTAILQARGSWRAKKRDQTEPQVDPGISGCPMKLAGEAKRMWEQLCEQLTAARILTELDVRALARYCRLWARWCDLAQSDDLEHLATMIKVSESLLRLEIQFGMTPSSRASVQRVERDTPVHGNAKSKLRFLADPDKSRFFITP